MPQFDDEEDEAANGGDIAHGRVIAALLCEADKSLGSGLKSGLNSSDFNLGLDCAYALYVEATGDLLFGSVQKNAQQLGALVADLRRQYHVSQLITT